MSISDQLLLAPENRIVGWVGGKGRDYFLRILASDLDRQGKKVVLSHFHYNRLPPIGKIVVEENPKTIQQKLKTLLREESILYIGRMFNENLLSGIDQEYLNELMAVEEIDYIFLNVGPIQEYSFLTKKSISSVIQTKNLNQLLYFFQVDVLDGMMEHSVIENPTAFLQQFPKKYRGKTFTLPLMLSYLTEVANGASRFFKQKWPAALILTAVDSVLVENKAVNFARELFARGIEHIFLANIREESVKKVPIK
ncbi:MAG: hypothetical protein Kow0042_21750 [Calditrichia bacterium]